AGVMVFLDPLSLRFDVGFQLSFLAVIGLIYLYPILESKFSKLPEWKGLKETLLMSISAQIMVAPLLAYVFHTFSLVSLPANILILPIMPYVMLFGFLTGIGGLILVPLGKAIGLIAIVLGGYQIEIVKWMASLPFASINTHLPTVLLVAIYVLIILSIWKTYLKKNQREA
ncbi:MAG: ComEC/Rec2 family competence protein, partial [Patescibacteria group bacterium]